jgi:hypothetical protein
MFDSRLCLLHSVQTGSEVHQASYLMSTEGCFPGLRQGQEAENTLSSGAEIMNSKDKHPLLHTSSWHGKR